MGAAEPTACLAGTYQPTAGAGEHIEDCLTCPVGRYCPTDGVSVPTLCGAGTYQPSTGVSTGSEACLECPAGGYCLEGSSGSTLCAAGTFGALAGGVDIDACAVCPAGSYCNEGVSVGTPCPAGRHRVTDGAEALRDCVLCPEGAYSLSEGLGEACPLCEADSFCQTPLSVQACPQHTTSPAGSYSKLACVCDPGFSCAYHKVIQAVIVVNSTSDDFSQDVGGVQSTFINLVAQAAGVDTTHVVINSITTVPDRRRRLLGVEEEGPVRSVSIVVSVAGAVDMDDLSDREHEGVGVLDHTWEEVHVVQATAVAA